jgi:hypothetical protein
MDTPHPASQDDLKANTHVLAFDIFGTVVDWHGSIMREVKALYPSVDANAFALAWRALTNLTPPPIWAWLKPLICSRIKSCSVQHTTTI